MLKTKKKFLSLIIWIIALVAVGAAFGNLTKAEINTWYLELNRSPLTPANYWFGIVWTILYVILAISGWMIWQDNNKKNQVIKRLYLGQLFLNWAWTPIFFTMHLVGTALVCIIAIATMVFLIIRKTYAKKKLLALSFIPYFIWLLFATYLNFYIWIYN